MANHNTDFRGSQEFAFRKCVRDAIRKGGFSKSHRDIMLSIVNVWFFRRNHTDGIIHPGREKLAKAAGVTVKTVSRCLADLRSAGVIHAVSHANGGWNSSTRYKVNLIPLFVHCGCPLPEWIPGNLIEQNVPQGHPKMSRKMGDKMSHGYIYGQDLPIQDRSFVRRGVPLKLVSGGK